MAQQYLRMQLDFKLTEPQAQQVCDAIADLDVYKKLTRTLYDVQLARTNNASIKNLGAYTVNLIKEALPNLFK